MLVFFTTLQNKNWMKGLLMINLNYKLNTNSSPTGAYNLKIFILLTERSHNDTNILEKKLCFD